MKRNRKHFTVFISIFLLAASTVILFGLHKKQQSAAPYGPVSNGEELYINAVSQIRNADAYRMEMDTIRATKLANQVLSEKSHKILSSEIIDETNLHIVLKEEVESGSHQFTIEEQYADGNAYVNLNGSNFSCSISQEDYLKRLPDIMLLNPHLYGTIDARQKGTMTHIGFYDAAEPEAWAAGSSAVFEDAFGYALLDSSGALIESSYTIIYLAGDAKIAKQVKVNYQPLQDKLFTSPPDPTSCVSIESMDIPRLLEKATGFLLQAKSIHGDSQKDIFCQAGNLRRQQNTELHLEELEDKLNAQVKTEVNLIDYNQDGTSVKYRQLERFQDDSYSLQVLEGDNAPNRATEINQDVMKKYCRDILVGSVLLPEYIRAIQVTETDHTYQFTFSAGESLADVMRADACSILYQDPETLSSVATSYHTDQMDATLTIQKETLLPVSSGLFYKGTHTIEGTSYELTSTIEQTYSFS